MPSPKWKLVVDIGEHEDILAAPIPATASADMQMDPDAHHHQADLKDAADLGFLTDDPPAVSDALAAVGPRDARVDEVVSMLGEFMPSDSNSAASNYVSGFMSLRLLLLRQSRNLEEDELVRTILDSYSSYTAGGRERSDIALMLARDYIFLSQQQSQSSLLGFGQSMVASSAGNAASGTNLSLFGLPSTSSSLQNSPALTPIPAPGTVDSMSIVSNT